MFQQALRMARGTASEEEVLAELEAYNQQACDPPLASAEVWKIAGSAYGYEVSGRNFSGTQGFPCAADLRALIGQPDSFWLFSELILAHPDGPSSGRAFAIPPRAMAEHGVAAPLSEKAIRKSRDHLVRVGILVQIRRGGSGPGDPSLFRFGDLGRLARVPK